MSKLIKSTKQVLTPKSVHLSPSLAKMVSIFNPNPGKHLHTFDFIEHEILTAASRICKLKDKGAIIDTVYKPGVSMFKGRKERHARLAHYKLIGWRHD